MCLSIPQVMKGQLLAVNSIGETILPVLLRRWFQPLSLWKQMGGNLHRKRAEKLVQVVPYNPLMLSYVNIYTHIHM